MASRKIEVQVIGDTKSLQKAFGSASKAGASFGSALGRTAKLAGLALGAAGIGGLAVVLKQGIGEFMEATKVSAQTGAALKSTGGIANVTARQVSSLAEAQMRLTGVDDELIQSGENLLLTFKNVRNEVGEGNKVFDRATVAALDLSQAGFGSVESASKMMGKALNDPIKGMTALGRAGVTFSDDQKKAIAALAKTGDLLGAQKIILKEVESQVGGSAAAYGKTLPGQLAILKQSFNNLAGSLVSGLMPAFSRATAVASKFVSDLSAAKGWRAKLNIVWEGVQEAGTKLTTAIGTAVASIDWAAAWSRARGIGEGLAARFATIDWTSVGAAIGDGIATGVGTASTLGKQLADSVLEASRKIDWVALGRAMGPGLAAAVVTAFVTLTDPAFWIRNWDLALAVFLATFTKGIGKLVAPVARLLGRFGGDAVLAIVAGIESFSPRIAAVLLTALTKLPGVVSKALGLLVAPVAAVFGRLGRIAFFIVKVLGIQAAIQAVGAFALWVQTKLQQLLDWVKGLPASFSAAAAAIGRAIVAGVLGGLGGLFTSVANSIKEKVGGALSWVKGHLGSTAEEHAAKMVGEPIAAGVILGWVRGSAALPEKLKETVRNAIEAARQAVEGARGSLSSAWGALSADALSAFDAIHAGVMTKTEKLLAKLQATRAAADRAGAVTEAQAGLATAMAGTDGVVDPAAVAAAQKQLDDALWAQREFGLQQRAAQERRERDASVALRRRHLEQELAELGETIAKRGAKAATASEAMIKLLGKYGVNFKAVGAEMGRAWITGLKESLEAAAQTAGALKGTITKAAAGINVPKLDSGGEVTRTGLAVVHRGETFSGVNGGGGGMTSGPVFLVLRDGRILAELVRNENAIYARANG